jgi:type I restriction enzyme S subunit
VSAVSWGAFRPHENKKLDASLEPRPEIEVRPGDLVLSRANTPELVGRAVLVRDTPPRLLLSDKLLRLRVDPSRAVPEFVNVVLASPTCRTRIQEAATGSSHSMKNISQGKLREISVLVPTLGEQRKIAAILSSVDDAIESTQAVIDQLGVVKKAMMAELLTRGLPGRHTRFKQTEIGEVPAEWEVVSVGQVAKVKGGKRMPKGRPFATHVTPFPYIRVTDFQDSTVRLDELKYVLPEDQLSIRPYTIFSDDLYISIAGTLGVVGEVPKELDGAQLTENAAKITEIDLAKADRTFLMYALQSPVSAEQVGRLKGVGSGVPKLALFRIESILVALPPLDEQRLVARTLQELIFRSRSEQQVLDSLMRVKSALMSVLLTGEVRVTPDTEHA